MLRANSGNRFHGCFWLPTALKCLGMKEHFHQLRNRWTRHLSKVT